MKKQEDYDISKLLYDAKKRRQKRKITPEYEKIISFLTNPPIKPSEVKLSTLHNKVSLNKIQNVKISESLRSLIKSKFSKKSRKKNSSTKNVTYQKGKKIHQIVPILAPRDAVGNEVIAIRNTLRNEGYNSEIYVETVHPEMAHESKSFFSLPEKHEADILIYHHATSSKLVDAIIGTSAKLVFDISQPYS